MKHAKTYKLVKPILAFTYNLFINNIKQNLQQLFKDNNTASKPIKEKTFTKYVLRKYLIQ